MRKVTYAAESFVTTDEVAHALVQFTTAVAQKGTSASVDVPAVDEDGQPVMVQLVIGPASEVISTPDPADPVYDARSEQAVAELRRLVAALDSNRTTDTATPTEAQPLLEPLPSEDDPLLA